MGLKCLCLYFHLFNLIMISFLFLGNAHQVQVLGRLVLTTAREGTQQFIKNIFSFLAGRLVFDVYKNNV